MDICDSKTKIYVAKLKIQYRYLRSNAIQKNNYIIAFVWVSKCKNEKSAKWC